MKNKFYAYFLICIMAIAMFSITVFAERQVKVELDGELIVFDVQPMIEKGRTLVPVRGVFEKMGAAVIWHAEEQKVTIEDKYKTIEMKIGNKEALIYRKYDFTGIPEKVTLEVPAQIIKNRTLIPLRFIAEILEADVDWDEGRYTVTIKTKGFIPKPEPQANMPVDFEVLEWRIVNENEELAQWYQENYKKEGIHSIQVGDEMYVIVSGGERPTGGYMMYVDEVSVVGKSRIASVMATLYRPAPDMMVTQAITYPHTIIKMSSMNIAVVRGEIKSTVDYRFGENVEYTVVDPQGITNGDIKDWYESGKTTEGIYYRKDNDRMYVLVAAGEMPTGGYSIDVHAITTSGPKNAYVYAALVKPAPGSVVTQAITYPAALVEIHGNDIQHIHGQIGGLE